MSDHEVGAADVFVIRCLIDYMNSGGYVASNEVRSVHERMLIEVVTVYSIVRLERQEICSNSVRRTGNAVELRAWCCAYGLGM